MSTNEIHDGSLKQLWKISSGLMISFLSMMTMIFVDRLFLSYYSTDALNAATSAGTFFWAGVCVWITLAAMAEVFVAQYNGLKQYKKLGAPVWQMIWLAVIAIFFFVFLGHFGSAYFFQSGFMNQSETEFFRWNNYFAPLFILLTALSAFYIGQGKTSIIKWLGIIGNGINVLLDPLFIFGYKGVISPMKIQGAAIATAIGVIIQIFILGGMFLSKKNRKIFGSNNYRFKPILFFKCLRVGASPAIFVMFELLGWATFYKMMEGISGKHLLIASITQSIVILFIFFSLGLEKGAAAVSGNLIGAKKFDEVKRLFRSGIKLSLIFGGILAIVFSCFSDVFIDLFFKNPEALNSATLELSPAILSEIKITLRTAMLMLIVYLTLANIRLLLNGLLTSAGDTFYLLVTGTVSIWLFMLTPTYFFIVRPKGSIETTFLIWIFYCIMSTSLLFYRFHQGKWKEKKLININETTT